MSHTPKNQSRLQKFFHVTDDTPSNHLMFRFLAGAYLIYIAYTVLPPSAEIVGALRIVVYLAGIAFILGGLYFIGAYFVSYYEKWRRQGMTEEEKANEAALSSKEITTTLNPDSVADEENATADTNDENTENDENADC